MRAGSKFWVVLGEPFANVALYIVARIAVDGRVPLNSRLDIR
jgi:hypothetical protein